MHPIAQSDAIGHAYVARCYLASTKREESRDTLNTVLAGSLWIFFDVHFDEARSGLQGLGGLSKYRSHRAARPVPRRAQKSTITGDSAMCFCSWLALTSIGRR